MTTYVNHPFRCFACTVTLMALLWLTIGFSFACNHPSTNCAHEFAVKDLNKHDSSDIPLENASEEKAELSSNDFTSEYLKEDPAQLAQINITINYNRYFTHRAFVNFCCDSVSPPPEPSLC
jgi:hypothetical protein